MTIRKLNRALLLAASATITLHSQASAATKTWAAAATGNWTDAPAWNLAGAPANGDTVLITANSATNYLVNYDNPSAVQTYPLMTLNSTGGGAAQLRSTAGGNVYNVTTATVGTNGEGHWQIGSANANLGTLILGASAGGTGTATINAGALDIANNFQIASFGIGVFTQTSGSVSANAVFLANQSTGAGTYQMNGGSLTATSALSSGGSGDGTFNQAGGVVSTNSVNLAGSSGASGRYNLSGGTLIANSLNVGAAGPGTFTLSAGQVDVVTARVGQSASGHGTMTQTGGTFNVSGSLILAAAAGAAAHYDFQGGALNAGSIVINDGGTFSYGIGTDLNASSASLNTGGTWVKALTAGGDIGVFNHNGGTVAAGFFNNSSSSYVYNSGAFIGRMDNLGTFTLNADMTMSDGMRNRSVATNTIPAGRTLTLDGQGLDQTAGNLFLFGTLNSTTSRVGGLLVSSTPVFAHQTGVHNVTTELRIGDGASAGTYNLNNGTLNIGAGAVGGSIGINQPGQLNLVNARANIDNLRVGQGAVGTFNHTGGGDLVATTITVGSLSAGTYIQNGAGASVSASNGLIIGTLGRYNLVNGTLTSAQTANNGTFTQTGGRATLNAVVGTGWMDVIGTASLTVDRIRQNVLNIDNTARIFTTANGTANGVSRLNGLFFGGVEFNIDGKWDLNNNDVVVDYTTASQYADIRQYVFSGFNSGSWNGDGLNSSAAIAAAATLNKTGIGYAEASSVFSSFPATFVGQSVDSTTMLVRYTLLGDRNLDGSVDIGDFANLASNFNHSGNWPDGDFNYNGTVDISDFSLQASNFNKALAGDLPRGAAVPEPVAATALLLGALAGRIRPRRNSIPMPS